MIDSAALISGALAFTGAILGAVFGPYVSTYLATRPTSVISLLQGEALDIATGWNREDSFIVANGPVVRYFLWIREAAMTRWGQSIVSYTEITEWLEEGARGPNGKPTIDRASSSEPHATVTRLIGHVFLIHR